MTAVSPDTRGTDERGTLLRLYREIARGRALEDVVHRLVQERSFRGFFHPGRGQEGLQAGVCAALDSDDYLLYAHRGLTYLTAKGMDPVEVLGDFHGRVVGSTRGLGAGTVHCVDPERGVMGQGGTLGSSFTLSAGLALASKALGESKVACAFFGDGASARGTFLEAGVTAKAWGLPVVWVCENNGWAVSARVQDVQGTNDIAPRAEALGFHTQVVDGQDALAVHEAALEAVAQARSGVPAFIEAKTERIDGHYTGDMQPYRDRDEVAVAKARDPLDLAGGRLVALGEDPAALAQIRAEAEAEMAAADAAARQSPFPDGSRIHEGLWA
ncbi:thiamine pyrophosphate-dependent dehydrogenase E1 component subunit alpha [Nocardioides soli]|uniref:Pyruvate dehydrogenase E1 component alpha subunit n=1 Tax=Nocardioides soli TaxID=1036020 RepID=A0A7W4VW40_9ACTN|nr:thiamine pyrophosphate-dependent dehydrogenase E1 component subunit alpha [Nocardioides soli]MBB3042848.1 pyruvate dehydrogenase E1 component alpha subunit [Nocardioides soli]